MSLIFENVEYVYMPKTPYEKKAISNINLEINKGEFVGIVGHTGSGKSTLAQHTNGLIKPTKGRVLVDGEDINAKGENARLIKRKIGLVFQYPEYQLFEETVFADIAFGPLNYGAKEEDVKRRVDEAMDFVGLDYTLKKRSPFHLSGGQMRRVAIAGVIALSPDYLILDEPSAGLDPKGRQKILEQIFRLHQETGIAVVMISHSMEEIAALAKRMIVMKKGSIILDDTPRNIFTKEIVKLSSAGIEVPEVVKMANELKKRGFVFEKLPLTLKEFEKAIFDKLGKSTH